MAPIRLGIIGLSPGQWAAKAHLPYLRGPTSKFEIMAVCNSSVESAIKSVKYFKLKEGTKVYGNVQDLANDKDVDLIVCTTRVDRHYGNIIPAIKAGKNVFVEWPLGKNLQEAQELLQLSREHNVKLTAVGLQGRFDSTIQTLQEILAEGRIGKVLSSTVIGKGLIGGPIETEGYAYLINREVGGSVLSIPASHCLDSIQQVLGEFSSFQSLLSNQRSIVKIVKADGSVIDPKAEKTTPDEIMVHGKLKSGAVMAAIFQGGTPVKDAQGLEWNILGEKGELRIRGPNAHIQMFGSTSIELHDFEEDKIEKIELRKGTFDEMDPVTRNMARIYEAIAAEDRTVLCDFEGAVKRHEFIEQVYKQNP